MVRNAGSHRSEFQKRFYQPSHTNEVTLVKNTGEKCQTKASFLREVHVV